VRIQTVVAPDADGAAVCRTVIGHITAEKQASQYARSLIEASLDPLVTISAEGKITDVNEGSIKATGVSREKLIGTDFSDYFTEPDKAREGYRQVFAKGFVTDYPLTIRHTDGRLTDVLYNATVYKDAGGNVLGVFAVARDVTERKLMDKKLRKLNEELTLSNRELEQFAYFQRSTGEFIAVTEELLSMYEAGEPVDDLPEWEAEAVQQKAEVMDPLLEQDYVPLPSQYEIHE
jgi:PAS domain S-box-containing protein